MRIAVIGAGAMGSIYGGHLSLHNDVYLIDTNQAVVDYINQNGLTQMLSTIRQLSPPPRVYSQ